MSSESIAELRRQGWVSVRGQDKQLLHLTDEELNRMINDPYVADFIKTALYYEREYRLDGTATNWRETLYYVSDALPPMKLIDMSDAFIEAMIPHYTRKEFIFGIEKIGYLYQERGWRMRTGDYRPIKGEQDHPKSGENGK